MHPQTTPTIIPAEPDTDRPVYRVAIPGVFAWADRELVVPAPHTADEIAMVVHAELVSVGYSSTGIDVDVALPTGIVRIIWDGAPLMTTITGPGVGEHRATFIAGLREMADFYEANPTLPMPLYPSLLVSCSTLVDGDDAAADLVRHAAEVLGVEAIPSRSGGGLNADKKFGALGLRVYHNTRNDMARYYAVQSYAGVVEPDAAQAVTR